MAHWEQARRALQRGRPRFLLAPDIVWRNGVPLIPPDDLAWLLRRYQVRATFGSDQATRTNTYWRGNRLRVWVLERSGGWRRQGIRENEATAGGNLEENMRRPDSGGRGERRQR